MTAAPPDRTGVILPIQYLRAFAAMSVVWLHAIEQMPGAGATFDLHFGASGVDVFFVISGFIMLATTRGRDTTAAGFLVRRLLRVAPLYWLATLAMLAGSLLAPAAFHTLRYSAATVVESLLFIPHWSLAFPGNAWPVLVPGWTLNYEMFFYVLFALSLALPARWRLAGLAAAIGTLAATGYLAGPFANPVAATYTSRLLLEFLASSALHVRELIVNLLAGALESGVQFSGQLLEHRGHSSLAFLFDALGRFLL